jgi:uncharacterized RDD family membrane protein YckC
MEENKLEYAGLKPRFFALLIDFILLSIIFFPATKIIKGVWIMSAGEHLWSSGWFITDPLCLIFLLIILLYFILMEGIIGATVGKLCLRLRVVQTDGSKSNLKQAIIRNLLRLVDSLPALNILGVILILGSPERARFGDRVAKTRVIKRG